GLHYGGFGPGIGSAGGGHDASGSFDYRLATNSPYKPYAKEEQLGWRYCKKCGGLHYGGFGPGICSAGGGHDARGSFDYRLATNSPYKPYA
ncbi:hypothetical protein, partial [Salmonella sp. SAL4456]|uniref:hypothetical protein n=1 Tax=Salmonella sp. SAL4456 TaxID=3159911 RepID=UPI00397BB234